VQVEFKIKPKNGAEEIVTAELVDVIAWEEKYERPSSELGGDGIFARDFVWLAWHAQFRTKKTTLEFMDWVATLDDIEGHEAAPLEPSENPQVIGSSPASA
jgi:hypothetical protein